MGWKKEREKAAERGNRSMEQRALNGTREDPKGRAALCLRRIGEIGELEKTPEIGDYWKAFRAAPPTESQMVQVEKRLADEVTALEQMGAMGSNSLTVLGKLWIYQQVIDRLWADDRDPAELNRLCTWADFKRMFAAEVAAMCRETTKWQEEFEKKIGAARRRPDGVVQAVNLAVLQAGGGGAAG